MRVGIAIPCHIRDKSLYGVLVKNIGSMSPAPDFVRVDFNDGAEGLKVVRSRLFDGLFEAGADVVVQISVDFAPFPNLLDYVEKDQVVTFSFIKRSLSTFFDFIKFRLSPDMWTALFSLPRDVWEKIKEKDAFDGSDSSIHRFLVDGRFPIKRVRSPKYWVRRQAKSVDVLANLSMFKKITKLSSRWR